MKKFLLCSTLGLCISVSLIAQDSTTLKYSGASNPYQAVPLITIKGEEIRRFPSNNFLDAVNGLFPWVFSLIPNSNDFLFVVNGFLLIDINSLSLNDIEEVTFTRNNLNGGLYPFSRAGTFFITTKKTSESNTLFSFSAQYNSASDKSNTVVAVLQPGATVDESTKRKSGHLFSIHGSVLAAGKKWNLYVSAQLDQSANPNISKNLNVSYSYMTRKDSSTLNGSKNQLNIRSFAQFTYRLSSKIDMGIYGSYFHGNINRDTSRLYHSQNEVFNNVTTGTATLPHYNGGAFINWAILKNLYNHVSFEYLYEKLDDNSNAATQLSTPQTPLTHSNNKTVYLAYDKSMLVRDELSYSFITLSKFQAGVSATFSYLDQKPDYKGTSVTSGENGIISASGSSLQYNQKLTSLNGRFYFSYNHIFSGYAGYAKLINKGISRFSSASKSNPYAGVELNIKNMLKTGNINRLDLSVNYGDLTRNNSNSYWLPEVSNSFLSIPSPIISNNVFIGFNTTIFPNPSLANIILKNRLVAIQVNAGFINNRLLAGIEWSQLELQNLYLIGIAVGGNNTGGVFVKGKETQKGISAYVAAKLVDKPFKKWTLRFNTLVPSVQHHLDAGNYPIIQGTNDQLQAGIQNHLSFHNWFLQLHGLTAFNKTTVNSFMFNYILAGYEFPGSNYRKQKICVFVQARNLLVFGALKNFYNYYSYYGGGVNISF
ncbi:MAG: hypothetical protein ABIN97_15770 [Ginsengibacter sp.]